MTNTLKINGNRIYNIFISGAQKLIYSEKSLNNINVFPVADGDTGTNLAMTMKMVVSNSKKDRNLSKTLSSIAEIAIENAYGNSGMIFAQFLNGFAKESELMAEISIQEFAEIAEKASHYTYEAVKSPKEGTILSVIRDWAKDLKTKLHHVDFEKFIQDSVEKARTLVAETTQKLKVLKDNNVVDAGAKGFLMFLEGMLEYLRSGKITNDFKAENLKLQNHTNIYKNTDVEINRYCTQMYIETNKTSAEIKALVAVYGDSIVVTGRNNRQQVHIHTDVPQEVVTTLTTHGTLISQKIEDMKLTNNIIHNRKYEVGIVTDSIADISQEILDNEQITIIPINLICDGVVYLDKLTMTPDMFYKKIDTFKMNPTSAQPSYNTIERAFSGLVNHFDSVIGIFVSKRMSGTFNNAQKVVGKLMQQGKKISVINSRTNSAAQGLLVAKAAELAAQGIPHDEMVEKLDDLKKRTRIFVSVKDLSHMIKGGRISKPAGYVLSKINLQPVVSIDAKGNGIVFKKTLTQQSAMEKILAQLKKDKQAKGIEDYAVVYSDSVDSISTFRNRVKSVVGKPAKFVVPISPVVGLNAGPGCFAVAYVMGGN